MHHLTIATSRDPANRTDFIVTVRDEAQHQLARIDAFSGDHAKRVADDVVLLIHKLDPKRRIVLESSLHREI